MRWAERIEKNGPAGVVAAFVVLAIAGYTACGRSSNNTVEPMEKSARSVQEQTEAARQAPELEQQRAVEAAKQRMAELRRQVDKLDSEAEPVRASLGADLRSSFADLGSRLQEAGRKVDSLSTAGTDGWKQAQSEATASLDGVQKLADQVSQSLEGQKRVLQERQTEQNPVVTGLIKGLDGEDYVSYSSSVVRDVQEALEAQGYYPGPADGYFGKPTMEAIARFQKDHGLIGTGVPTPKTREKLFHSA